MTRTECAGLPVPSKRLFYNHASIISGQPANRKERIKFIYKHGYRILLGLVVTSMDGACFNDGNRVPAIAAGLLSSLDWW